MHQISIHLSASLIFHAIKHIGGLNGSYSYL